jgi:oligopeptide/dipeptide ABC transporter ATP-binding protein
MSTALGEAVTPKTTALLEVEELRKYFPIRRGVLQRQHGDVKAVDGVSFALDAGQTMSLVGESGCGKTTTGRLLVRLLEPTGGRILYRGQDIATADRRELCGEMQIMFQDPYASLSPRLTVHDIVAEPLRIHHCYRTERVRELLDLVGLSATYENRYAHEFSGGQRQRIGLARALALDPKLLVLDEPVSALDAATQARAVNLLAQLQHELGLAYLFIAHDLLLVHHVCDRIAVMYLGAIAEVGPADRMLSAPRHPYTEALISAIPARVGGTAIARRHRVLRDDAPTITSVPTGCRFRTRCPYAFDRCVVEEPALTDLGDGSWVACHLGGVLPDRVEDG